ncbi:MAG: hypothetical protein AAF936_01875 [Pseudomonadota bacterium]
MKQKLKLITSLSTLALTGALAVTACSGEGEGEGHGAEGEGAATSISGEGESEGLGGESEGEGLGGESEGEGLGGESEGEGAASSGDPATDDIEYLYRLALVRGHLIAFRELYDSGEREMALGHSKHPQSELYAGLAPAFEARSKPGFADQLSALASAAEAGGDIDDAYNAVADAIAAHFPDMTVKTRLLAVSKIVSTAADEFDIGVEDDGAITNAHEYQDAYGFLNAARMVLASGETSDMAESEAVAMAQEQLDIALSEFDGLTAATTEGAASVLYGAAARIEIAALGL